MSDEEDKQVVYIRLPVSTIAMVKQHIKDVGKETGLNVSIQAMMDSLLLLGLGSPEAKALAGKK